MDIYMYVYQVQSIMRHVTSKIEGATLEELHTRITWPLYVKYGHAYDAFKTALSDKVDVFEGLDVDERTKGLILENVRRRLTPQPVKVRADIELTCFTYEGIEAIRAALLAGQAETSEEVPLKIMLIAPPEYVLLATVLDGDAGVANLNRAIERISEVITSKGGKCVIKMAAKITSERDESDLKDKLEDLARQNQEIDGDDDDEEDE
jgi:translation initiation factor 2 subunit 1